jgi:hypothetical protein
MSKGEGKKVFFRPIEPAPTRATTDEIFNSKSSDLITPINLDAIEDRNSSDEDSDRFTANGSDTEKYSLQSKEGQMVQINHDELFDGGEDKIDDTKEVRNIEELYEYDGRVSKPKFKLDERKFKVTIDQKSLDYIAVTCNGRTKFFAVKDEGIFNIFTMTDCITILKSMPVYLQPKPKSKCNKTPDIDIDNIPPDNTAKVTSVSSFKEENQQQV